MASLFLRHKCMKIVTECFFEICHFFYIFIAPFMIHPHTELKFIGKQIGFGIVSTQLIPAGTITWALDPLDVVFTPDQICLFDADVKKILDTYCYIANTGNWIYCWDISKYMNHSFNSNCLSTAYDFELAIRDIQKGEQLTCDYGYLNTQEPFSCLPETNPLNRLRVMPNDLLDFSPVWDKQLEAVFPFITTQKQPLLKYISKYVQHEIEGINTNKKKMKSILNCLYRKEQGSGLS